MQSQTKAQWEWNSNPNTFSDSKNAQWIAYSKSDNEKLEEAYQSQQKEIDLGDYIISIQDMLQKKKDNIYKQRHIRRNIVLIEECELEKEDYLREERFFGSEIPRTFNKAFGSLQHYLKFFENRGPEIREFAKLFNDIEAKNDIGQLNSRILPCLVDCIKAESMKVASDRAEKRLLSLFQPNIHSFEQFYAHVLRAYTIESFLYKNMNFYLRNEDWTELQTLLSYAYCLCKAFFCHKLASNQPEDLNEEQKIILYRGAAFDEATLSFYDPNIVKNFCWNAVTSTSKKLNIAQKFIDINKDSKKPIPVLFIIEVPLLNVEKEKSMKWIDIQQYSAASQEDEVILPPGSVFELTGVSRDELGAEIRLKLILHVEKLAHQGQLMYGAMLSEMAQDKSFKFVCLEGRELTEAITHLKGNQTIEELEFCLCKLDEKIGVNLAETLEKIPRLKKLILTSPLSANQSHWSVIFKNLRKVCPEGLEIDGDTDSLQLSLIGKEVCNLTSLTSLTLNFRSSNKVTDEDLCNLGSQGLKHLASLGSLILDFRYCDKITNEGLKSLSFEGLKHLTSLTSLALNFRSCEKITDQGLYELCFEGLQHLTSLTSLSLDFCYCSQISDKGLKNLSFYGIQHLTLLVSLMMNFCKCEMITIQGSDYLCQKGIKLLSSLKFLNLYFGLYLYEQCFPSVRKFLHSYSSVKNTKKHKSDRCMIFLREIEGEENFSPKELLGGKVMTSDTAIILNTGEKLQIFTENLFTDDEEDTVENLFTIDEEDTVENLFTVDDEEDTVENLFTVDDEKDTVENLFIGDDEEDTVENLFTVDDEKDIVAYQDGRIDVYTMKKISWCVMEIACYTTSIVSLTLDLNRSKLTDELLQNICCKGLKCLTSLTSLSLNLRGCENLTDNALQNLSNDGLRHLTSLTSLSLNLSECKNLTDNALQNLCTDGLKHLTSLRLLSLDVTDCNRIADEGLCNLSSQGLKDLNSLTSLTLNLSTFSRIGMNLSPTVTGAKISDQGLNSLVSQAFKFLTSLTSLTLDFHYCDITDEALNYLSSQGLKNMTSLKSLTLDLSRCMEVTDVGVSYLCHEGLKYLENLTSLALNFSRCKRITDEALNSLCCHGLNHLKSLLSLTLDLGDCPQITSQGLNTLYNKGVKPLTSLVFLSVDIRECWKIKDMAWENFHKVLKYLGFLPSSFNPSHFL